MAIPLDAYDDPKPTRKPGDFRRKGIDGPPYVPSLTETRIPKGLKAELVDKCAARGLPTDGTVPELRERLGPEPADDLYARPSGMGDALENQYALRKFIERGIGAGVIRLVLDGLDPTTIDLDDPAALDRLVIDAQDVAQAMIWANRGTHVHKLCERHENGQAWDDLIPTGEALGIPADAQRAIVAAWAEFRSALGLRSLRREVAIVNDQARAAGHADLIDIAERPIATTLGTIEAGEAITGDIKTGDPRDKYAVQIAIYNDGVPFDTETEQRLGWDVQPNTRIAFIYHMSMKAVLDGEAPVWTAIPVDLTAGRDGLRICAEARDWPSTPVFGEPIKETPCPATASSSTESGRTAKDATGSSSDATGSSSSLTSSPPKSPPASTTSFSASGKGQPPTAIDEPSSPSSEETRRQALRDRVALLNDEQAAAFRAHGFTKSTPTDVIAAALDAIDPFATVAPLAEPQPEPAAPEPERHVDRATLDALVEHVKTSPVKDVVNGWIAEGNAAGARWNPLVAPTVTNYERTRAALALAWMCSNSQFTAVDLNVVRELLRAAIGDPAAEWPVLTIGHIIGQMDTAAALRAHTYATALGDTITVTHTDDGRPVLHGIDAVAA